MNGGMGTHLMVGKRMGEWELLKRRKINGGMDEAH